MSSGFESSKRVYRVQTAETYFRLQIIRILILFGLQRRRVKYLLLTSSLKSFHNIV